MQETRQPDTTLEEMWISYREAVRHQLISLARDIDVADDLLQEAYLRAVDGLPSYRGENPRAWLSMIARNVFLGHLRYHRTRPEDTLDDGVASDLPYPGCHRFLDMLALRQAVEQLPTAQHTALVMKHYGGFSYEEIAERLDCPAGTAKWYVRDALDKLRLALREEAMLGMKCSDLMGTPILDYLYGALPPDDAEPIRDHLLHCPTCRRETGELRRIGGMLAGLDREYRQVGISEVVPGGALSFVFSSMPGVTGPGPFTFMASKFLEVRRVMVDGEELPVSKEQHPEYESAYLYTMDLPDSITQTALPNMLIVGYNHTRPRRDDGSYTVGTTHSPSPEHESVYVHALRLPAGARVLSADPKPHRTVAGRSVTLVWRAHLEANEPFKCETHYEIPETPGPGDGR